MATTKTSSKIFITIILSIVSIAVVVILAVALTQDKKDAKDDKHRDACLDSMAIIVITNTNEHHKCEHPQQKIEVYTSGDNRALVKCLCQRKENKEKIEELR